MDPGHPPHGCPGSRDEAWSGCTVPPGCVPTHLLDYPVREAQIWPPLGVCRSEKYVVRDTSDRGNRVRYLEGALLEQGRTENRGSAEIPVTESLFLQCDLLGGIREPPQAVRSLKFDNPHLKFGNGKTGLPPYSALGCTCDMVGGFGIIQTPASQVPCRVGQGQGLQRKDDNCLWVCQFS